VVRSHDASQRGASLQEYVGVEHEPFPSPRSRAERPLVRHAGNPIRPAFPLAVSLDPPRRGASQSTRMARLRGSDHEQDHDEGDGYDEGEDGDRASVHGASER
jgi:hypothetical protein